MVNSDSYVCSSGNCAIFIAILAGFYTAKLIAIASDKKRLLITMGEVKNEIEWRTKKAQDLASVIEQKVYDDYNHEERELEHLQNQLKSYEKDFVSIIYPSHLKVGYFSFILFSVLGGPLPISHQWWTFIFKGNSDIFAFLMFVLGLSIVFFYIFEEMSIVVRDRTV